MIKTWQQRCEEHPDHDGIVTERMIQARMQEEIDDLRAAIEQAQEPETELETYKRLYELRGKALERPCSNCGHQPAKIKAMAQPEQEPVAWMWADGTITTDPDRADGTWTPLYTAPSRKWQRLTQLEIDELWYFHHDDYGNALSATGYERAIEARLKEKNT